MMGIDTPETYRGWRILLKISFASSWFPLDDVIFIASVEQATSIGIIVVHNVLFFYRKFEIFMAVKIMTLCNLLEVSEERIALLLTWRWLRFVIRNFDRHKVGLTGAKPRRLQREWHKS